jgi:hypothetical protein
MDGLACYSESGGEASESNSCSRYCAHNVLVACHGDKRPRLTRLISYASCTDRPVGRLHTKRQVHAFLFTSSSRGGSGGWLHKWFRREQHQQTVYWNDDNMAMRRGSLWFVGRLSLNVAAWCRKATINPFRTRSFGVPRRLFLFYFAYCWCTRENLAGDYLVFVEAC